MLNNKSDASSLDGIDIRYNPTDGVPEWSIRGADSWNPFKKQVSSSYIGEVAVGETKDLGNQYDFLIVQPLLKDTLTYELTQVIDVANEPSGSFYYAAYAYATGASGNQTWTDNYYNSCRTATYTVTEDASTGNTILTINSGSGVIVSGMKASEMNLLGRFSAGASVDTTGYSAIAVVKEVRSISYRHLLLQGDMGEGKGIPNITTGFTQVYSGGMSVDYFTSAALYDWVSDGAKDFFTAPYECKVYGIM